MKGRTYRYFEKEPLYPFGYGLSYTSFKYSNLRLSATRLPADNNLNINVDVENTGKLAGREVVQLYISDVEASVEVPMRQLCGIQCITLEPEQKQTISFTIKPQHMALFDYDGKRVLEPGQFIITVGGHQPDQRSTSLTGSDVLTSTFEVV
jgi:beta-glucosidase